MIMAIDESDLIESIANLATHTHEIVATESHDDGASHTHCISGMAQIHAGETLVHQAPRLVERRCKSCGAPMPAHSATCQYCGMTHGVEH